MSSVPTIISNLRRDPVSGDRTVILELPITSGTDDTFTVTLDAAVPYQFFDNPRALSIVAIANTGEVIPANNPISIPGGDFECYIKFASIEITNVGALYGAGSKIIIYGQCPYNGNFGDGGWTAA